MRGKKLLIIGAVCAGIVLLIMAVGAFQLRREAGASSASIVSGFQQAADDLFHFRIGKARVTFESVNEQISELADRAKYTGVMVFSRARNLFGGLNSLGSGAVEVAKELDELKSEGFSRLFSSKGSLFLENLERLHVALITIADASAGIQQYAAATGFDAPENAVETSAEVYHASRFVGALVEWLKSPAPQHIIIAFQNTSEIRPTGGFIGSYAHLTLEGGSISALDVRDIYDPDGQLDDRIIPPTPLQGITSHCATRDANWFFDFPTSARKVLSFLERSKIYSEQNITFSGLIAFNVDVVEDLLGVTGPIELKEYDIAIGADNFLSEVQYEVESGEDKQAGEPKRILKVLTPLLLERLASLEEAGKERLAERITARMRGKDIQFFFKDLAMESYVQVAGVGGEVAPFRAHAYSDSLAVVAANIAGGKSDAFTTQNIHLESVLEHDGSARNILTITRTHTGQGESEWWYRAANKGVIQMWLPPHAEVQGMEGGTRILVTPLINYRAASYTRDAELASFEAGLLFPHTIIERWFEVPAGSARTLTLSYTVPDAHNGTAHAFVFDKQSGVQGSFIYSVRAPAGLVWQENGSSVMRYQSDELPARVSLQMTLVPKVGQR